MPKKRYTPEEIVAGCGVLVSQGQNIADAIRLTLDKLIRKEAPDVGYAGA